MARTSKFEVEHPVLFAAKHAERISKRKISNAQILAANKVYGYINGKSKELDPEMYRTLGFKARPKTWKQVLDKFEVTNIQMFAMLKDVKAGLR
jgi:hypothetical protein